mmetsp:Transcript_41834/g.83951  ORF Transcript_41834/g.83951 Transcript_41834/m.83951 type:complete len:277 (+) Transcript_41834:677-1507(+)
MQWALGQCVIQRSLPPVLYTTPCTLHLHSKPCILHVASASRNLNERGANLGAVARALRVALNDDLLIAEGERPIVAGLVASEEGHRESGNLELDGGAADHRRHGLHLHQRVVILPRELDSDEVDVVSVVRVLLARPAEVVDVPLLLLEIVLYPVVQPSDLTILLLADEDMFKTTRVVVAYAAVRGEPQVEEQVLKVGRCAHAFCAGILTVSLQPFVCETHDGCGDQRIQKFGLLALFLRRLPLRLAHLALIVVEKRDESFGRASLPEWMRLINILE